MPQVLDKGEVILLDSMASDFKPVGAARISTGKRPEDATKGEESDRKLLHTLMTEGHGSPFEHAVFQFYVKAPLFVFREWHRHRMASYNEQSGRYAKFKQEFYVPSSVRVAHPQNKQMSVEAHDDKLFELFYEGVNSNIERSWACYEALIEAGVAREMARMVLPVNLYSSMWWTVNARAVMLFLQLRNSPQAQWEIAEYARAIEEVFAELMPWTYEQFVANGRIAP